MRRGPKPAKSKEAKPPVARKSSKNEDSRIHDLEKRLAEALEQQTATAEILGIISSSPADAQPVFDAIALNALRLCDAKGAVVVRYDGELLHLVAHHNVNPEAVDRLQRQFPLAPDQHLPIGRAVLDGAVVHVPDLQAAVEISESVARQFGARSQVVIPLLHQGRAVGAIGISRPQLGPFSDRQIELLKTFADQAVIAIENVRLFNETKESLDQQTATAEILGVISSSPTDIQPVFDTIIGRAVRLCDARLGALLRLDGQMIHLAAHAQQVDAESLQALQTMYPMPVNTAGVSGRALLSGTPVHVRDMREDPELAQAPTAQVGHRTVLSVPMMREGAPIGVITVARARVEPFADRQVELLQTFADQAVIAIENVRLFKELQARNAELTTSLDTQTATSDILRVISHAQTDVQPVFDAILASAVRLLQGYSGVVTRLAGDQLDLAALTRTTDAGDAAVRALYPERLDSQATHVRATRNRAPLNIADAHSDPQLPEVEHTRARVRGYRSHVVVPLLRQDEAIGTIGVTRRDPGGFTDDEIALLQTFADQAVIAIENVRLFTELQEKNRALTEAHAQVTEALEQQTATSEILRVISSSPTDLQPVLDSVAESAGRLCEASDTQVYRLDADELRLVAHYGAIPTGPVGEFTVPVIPGVVSGRTVLERRIVHVADLQTEENDFPVGSQLARRFGYRASLSVPLMREGLPLGAIHLRRIEAQLFTERQIALLQTFADQAVIAIENVRLFKELQTSNRELRTALDTQTATSDILGVISRSQTDVQPVFDAIVTSALRLLRAYTGALTRVEGDQIVLVALTSTDAAADAVVRAAFPQPLQSAEPHPKVAREGTALNIADAHTDSRLTEATRAFTHARDFRSWVLVPLLRQAEAVGAIGVTRREPGGFTDDEIALLQTFADQAVIAIENVRLFKELQEKNEALTQAHAQVTEALEQQTATSEILRTITHSQTDAQPVFDTIVHSAVRLLRGYSGTLTRIAGGRIELAAFTSTGADADAAVRASYPRSLESEGTVVVVIRERVPLNVATAQTDPRLPQIARTLARGRGFQSLAAVPLLRHDEAVGAIMVTRREPGGFTDEEIALLKTFADQAVIAIENARLLTELHARTAELTQSVGELRALGEVGQAISSTLDLQTVLSTIVARATQLSGTDAGVIYEYDEQREVFVPRATEHLEAEIVETMLATPVRKGEGATGRLAEVQEPIQVPDILAAPAESRVRGALVRAGYRALLAVPLVRDDHLLGGLTVIRKATGEFAPEVIELLRTFATQSALAIQNARLFREIEDKSRQLEVASQHKSEFLANMSHELRTPLNAIIGFSEVLTDRMFGDLNEKQEEYLKDIYASGTHLLSLINDILDLSKIEAGRMELELTDFHLPTALDNALTLVRERAGRRSITLQMSVDERLGEVRADERKIRQVVLNLLSNAIKFTPEGGQIEVAAVSKDGAVEVSVSDTGVGIAPEDQEAVFEEFRQVGTAEKKAEGTGLGLTLCRKFIELHSGWIRVKSEVGVGSTFTFTIPVRFGG